MMVVCGGAVEGYKKIAMPTLPTMSTALRLLPERELVWRNFPG
jgi:hypothetical protein